MVLAQHPAAAVQGVLVQVAGGLHLPQLAQVDGEVIGGDQGVGVVLAQHPALAVQGVLVQVAGFGVAAHVPERPGKVVRDRQRVLVVVAEPVAPLLAQIAGQVMGGAGIAAGQQVPARVAGHPAQVGVAGGGEVGGQQVRHQLRPPRPGDGIVRVAGVAGGQDRLGCMRGWRRPGRG